MDDLEEITSWVLWIEFALQHIRLSTVFVREKERGRTECVSVCMCVCVCACVCIAAYQTFHCLCEGEGERKDRVCKCVYVCVCARACTCVCVHHQVHTNFILKLILVLGANILCNWWAAHASIWIPVIVKPERILDGMRRQREGTENNSIVNYVHWCGYVFKKYFVLFCREFLNYVGWFYDH